MILEKEVSEHTSKICVSSFSTTFVWNFFILRRTDGDTIIKAYLPPWRVHVILVEPIFSTDFDKVLKYQI
jgi:hypothetical protein